MANKINPNFQAGDIGVWLDGINSLNPVGRGGLPKCPSSDPSAWGLV